MITLLDCTLRDGGYYNTWDFPTDIVNQYLVAMKAAQVDIVELGFRFLGNSGFKGACAYTTDEYIRTLDIPEGLTIGVMMNGADLLSDLGLEATLEKLFPAKAADSPVDLVRFACHFREFDRVLPASKWLADRGYRVGFNVMQIADRSYEEVLEAAEMACNWPVEALYFADSMGSMTPADAARIVKWLREKWSGDIGIHTHDNMGMALQNTFAAYEAGATWLDATVTGMGRGPGNCRTEELIIEAESITGKRPNLVPLMELIESYFQPMKNEYGWGSNPYYFLSGKYGIHPTYIQEMLSDSRYNSEDVLGVIEHLRNEGGKSYNAAKLDMARSFYGGDPVGHWSPSEILEGRDVLLLGAGKGLANHSQAVEQYIAEHKPVVMALNTQSALPNELINLRVACHPVRLLADCDEYASMGQPLITPASMLPADIRESLGETELLDFGLGVKSDAYEVHDTYCLVPNSLVVSYALAIAASGKAKRVLLAGFDGYASGDPRNDEMDSIFQFWAKAFPEVQMLSITPTIYKLAKASVYGPVV